MLKCYGFKSKPLFNADGGASGGSGSGASSAPSGEAGTGNDGQSPKTYTQAEVDSIVNVMQEKHKNELNSKLSEAEKLSKMNDDEKAAFEAERRKEELDKREKELTKRELMVTAKGMLAEKKLPAVLAQVLDYSDAEKCTASVAAVEKAFRAAVEESVNERLKGGKPPKAAPADSSSKGLTGFVDIIRKNQVKR